MLWAWEWPQDLRTLDPARAGVAYLGGALSLAGDDVLERPRQQPLLVPAGVSLVVVVRVQVVAAAKPTLSEAQARRTAAAILSMTDRPGLAGVQVDFDAARSERAFYRLLLRDLRAGLPDSLPITMTALASWGLGDPWLEGLPVEAAVPMVFRMGSDAARVRSALAGGADFSPAWCRGNIGVALDEPVPPIWRSRRVWVFHHGPWSPATVARVLNRFRR